MYFIDKDEWESSIRNEICPSSGIEFIKKSAFFVKAIANLTNQALLAAVSNKIHRDISNSGDIVARIKRLGSRIINSRID